MKVKIGKFLFDPEMTPVMLVLNEKDKANIAMMDEDANSYAAFPDGYDHESVQRWMADEDVVIMDAIRVMLMSHGMTEILLERDRQIEKGYDIFHDRIHGYGVLSLTANELILQANDPNSGQMDAFGIITKHGQDRQKLLQIAGALIAAELDMLVQPEQEELT